MTTNAVPKPAPPKRIAHLSHLRWVAVADMVTSSVAQRELKQYRVDQIVAHYDEDKIGTPILSHRDGDYYVVDGQHRVEATRVARGEHSQIQCRVYEGLDESAEAELFLRFNDTLTVSAFDKFLVSVEAKRQEESDVNRIVKGQGLVISRDNIPGGIRAVGTLSKVYDRDGAVALRTALGIIRDAFGDSGFEAPVINGMGLLVARYHAELDVPTVVTRLSKVNGGVKGLLGKAEVLRRQTGGTKAHCVAAAVVDVINTGRGGRKLPSWWKSE